jgi:hypothetical protein
MRTEAEIRQKLKEIDDDGWHTGDILKSSVTHYLIETRLLKWVLEEYEYLTEDPIVEDVRRVREDLAEEAGYDSGILLDNTEKAVEKIEKEYGIKWKRVTRVEEKLSMHTILEKLKKDMYHFRKILEDTDPSFWTPERFSKVNAMFTMIEEEVMNTERKLRGTKIEYKELMSDLRSFMGIHVEFRKRYFETRGVDREFQFRWS